MPLATVILPTHNHEDTLQEAIPSALDQSLDDFELFIVGDGVTDETREIVAEFCRVDSRLRFFDCPKGRRKGEEHRHAALQEASGTIVAYLGDDDLWLQHHLAEMAAALMEADLVASLNTVIEDDGSLSFTPCNLEDPGVCRRMLEDMWNCFDFTFAAHTLAAYKRLPGGLGTVPEAFPAADLFLWRQFLAAPWCRARTVNRVTALNTATHRRTERSNRERARELAGWREKSRQAGFTERTERAALAAFGGEAVIGRLPETPDIFLRLGRRLSRMCAR